MSSGTVPSSCFRTRVQAATSVTLVIIQELALRTEIAKRSLKRSECKMKKLPIPKDQRVGRETLNPPVERLHRRRQDSAAAPTTTYLPTDAPAGGGPRVGFHIVTNHDRASALMALLSLLRA